MRYFIKFSYNGTNYHGWQIQPNAISVQETLTNAMSVILNQALVLTGAGRTDTGVHAREMYAHFDMDFTIEIALTVYKINSFLPKDIVVLDIILVHDDAHARFDAKKRTYQYHINTFKNPFLCEQSWFYHTNLDVDLMNEAAKLLFVHNDFESFSKSNTDVNTFNCKIFEANWTSENGNLIFTITADRFLRNMVRSIVGTLVNIGLHKTTISDFINIIEAKDRTKAGFSVPACGLFLKKIEYNYI
jgi:tRNA pseudouridine38-40 synthase